MAIQKLRPTYTFDQDRLEKIKAIIPEAFADGVIKFDVLRDLLGDAADDDVTEHFGLTWPGKREARRLAGIPSRGTLVPAPGEGVNETDTRNLFIEGNNLEVLKLLQKSYSGRVKLIYIDPPYNTGNDFIYKDDFSESREIFLERTGQMEEGGGLLTTNPKSDGRFHSNWLNMMYPRLRLARDLLRDDGVIFVSIDDNESANLRLLMDEVFGPENFCTQIAWQKKYSVSNNYKGIASIKDIILVYSRSELFENGLLPRDDEAISRYSNPDNDPRGPWKAVDYWNQASPEKRPNLVYTITNPHTGQVIVPTKKAWKYSREVHEQHVADQRIWWGVNGSNTVPALKLFLSEVKEGVIPHNWWTYKDAGHTDEAKKDLQNLFGGIAPFDTPKPTKLLKRIFQVANLKETDIILDFFAGSCTTGQAVLEFSRSNEVNYRFIMIQIPEAIDNPDFSTIAEVGKERIRRAIKRLQQAKENRLDLSNRVVPEDLGFKVYKLTHSNFKLWQDYEGNDIQEIQQKFNEFEEPLIDDWKEHDLLVEIILIHGFPLDSIVSHLSEYPANKIMILESDFFQHNLLICLDSLIADETVESLTLGENDVFVCLDVALTNQAKMQLLDRCNLSVI